MKSWLVITGLLLLLLVAGFFTVTKLIMPQTAVAFLPAKWQNIPLGQKRNVVQHYLGEPIVISPGKDEWRQQLNESKRYVLSIQYSPDSIARRYDIVYQFKLLFFSDAVKVKSDSIP